MSETADPDELLAQSNPVIAVAVLGRQVELFLDTDIGRYLLQCADAQMDDVMSGFAKVSPQDAASIMALQVKLGVATSFKGWLADSINSGKQAMNNLGVSDE